MKLFIYLILLLFSLSAISAPTYNFSALSQGKIKVVINGISGGEQKVIFYKKHKNSNSKTQVDSEYSTSGNLSHVIRTSFNSDEQVYAEIPALNSNHLSRTYANLGGSDGDHDQPRIPERDPIPDSKIKDYADQQARTVANRIALTYGKRENFRFNFVNGLWNGYNLYRVFENRNQNGWGVYQEGLEFGKSKGYQTGKSAGISDAQTIGQSKGANEAHSRFVQAVNTGDLNTSLEDSSIQTPAYNGAAITGGFKTPSVKEKIQSLESSFRSKLYAYTWSYGGYDLDWSDLNWSLWDAYNRNGAYDFVDSWFREDYAYSEWKSNRLGGRYDYNLYNKMNDSEKSSFNRYFKNIYDNVIEEKFYREKEKRNPEAYSLGQSFGFEIGKEMAYQEGLVAGYKAAFTSTSINYFHRNYKSNFKVGYDNKVSYHMNNPVLDSLNASIQGSFLPEGSIDVVITNLRNIGAVEATNLSVNISGISIKALHSSQKISIAPLSNLKEKVVLKNAATIVSSVNADEKQAVLVSVEKAGRTRAYFSVQWANIIEAFAQMDSANTSFKKTLNYISNQIKEEWKIATQQYDNWYKDGKQGAAKTLLEQLVALYSSSDSSAQDNIEQIPSDAICEMVSGHTWIKSSSKYYMAIEFKKLYQKIDNSCEIGWWYDMWN